MADEDSTLAELTDVIGRLGRLVGDVVVEQVAALNLEQAVDLWTAFASVPRPSEPIGD
ncbi:hypothetical protein AB0E59_44475 [Lentzea sp. NPDC034063]|uniref:hypothetical protein n=1 Tax=unclassified Lentzea TaxID=2643253 RepID=UPI0033D25516